MIKTTVACHGCGTDLAPARATQVVVKGAGQQREMQPMCRHCAANHAAKKAFGGVYLSMASGPNRAARRQQAQVKAAPVVRPAQQRKPTRGERRAAKKADAAKRGKQVAA
jgi:RNase P subunit RPR2